MLIPTVFSFKFLKVSTKIENKEVTNIFVHIQNNLSKFPFTITKKYVNCHSFLYLTNFHWCRKTLKEKTEHTFQANIQFPKGLPSDDYTPHRGELNFSLKGMFCLFFEGVLAPIKTEIFSFNQSKFQIQSTTSP